MSPAGELRLLGRLVDASNETYLVADEEEASWVYKPVAGEQPLWDFPDETLGRREVAAYAISEALGLGIVPRTVWGDGPLGEGSLQRFVDGVISDVVDLIHPEQVTEHWLPVASGFDQDRRPVVLVHRDDPRLRRMALFDALVNNSDRKAGHIIEADGALFGVDHGVSLHVDDKLRTVLWGFANQPFTDEELDVAERCAGLGEPLAPGLADEEWAALKARARRLAEAGAFPGPTTGWPAIPWPPF
ncbi:SCO1664 family protein [Tessaracoccus oleiagri]|uniref:PI3K/PI4K catalytic domain-containing protein n=1 Tax=Tessaracoccus oleiagri TaxID=686624 RepID=A0A1G9J4R3_9ACTN|nr:SCO1664 family protein [Tessaracoccus oleiagri]SDL32518.1 conserved hypothetical protein [Tessaracoccus oleiagri]